jgi:hypothetical protein
MPEPWGDTPRQQAQEDETRPIRAQTGANQATPSVPANVRPGGVPRTDTGPDASAHAPAQQRLWGTRPGRLGVFTVIGGAFAGLLITVFIGREPGFIIGLCVIVATVIGSLAVRPKAAYMVIPAPALSYFVAATIAGYAHDHASDTSHAALAISGVQWAAREFIPMVLATALAILVAATRWGLSLRRTGLKWDPEANERRRAAAAGWPYPGSDGGGLRDDGERPRSGLPAEPPRSL